jgi:hypothetical protein
MLYRSRPITGIGIDITGSTKYSPNPSATSFGGCQKQGAKGPLREPNSDTLPASGSRGIAEKDHLYTRRQREMDHENADANGPLNLSPLTQVVKTQNSFKGELSHGIVETAFSSRKRRGR